MNLRYRPEIDGLRAVAVVPVILFHAGFRFFEGGFIGVDIFFVISGYLITSIIIQDLEKGTFSFKAFYERRARRILPALFFVILCTIPFAWLWLFPAYMREFSASITSVVLFSSNIFFWNQIGYFDTASELKPLLHTWSLSVEEQYYLIFPLIIFGVYRYGRRLSITLIAMIAIASFIASIIGATHYPNANFYLLPTRAWELMAGSLCAFGFTNSDRPSRNFFALLGLIAILASIILYDASTPFPSFYTLLPILGTCAVILFGSQHNLAGRILSLRPVVAIGLVSYSAYLWHQPLFALARNRVTTDAYLMTTLCLITLMLAYLSWRFVEIPFRYGRARSPISTKNLIIISTSTSLALILFGLGGSQWTRGYQNLIARPVFDERLYPGFDLPQIGNGWCFQDASALRRKNSVAEPSACHLNQSDENKINAILFGDSFAGQYEPFWQIVGKSANLNVQSLTSSWCYPTTTEEFTGNREDRSYELCLKNRSFLFQNASRFDLMILGGHWGQIKNENKLDGVFNAVSELSSLAKIVVIMASPTWYDANVGDAFKRSVTYGVDMKLDNLKKDKDRMSRAANIELQNFALKYENVIFIDRNSIFNVNGAPSDTTVSGRPFALDDRHISIYGSKEAGRAFIHSQKYNELLGQLREIVH